MIDHKQHAKEISIKIQKRKNQNKASKFEESFLDFYRKFDNHVNLMYHAFNSLWIDDDVKEKQDAYMLHLLTHIATLDALTTTFQEKHKLFLTEGGYERMIEGKWSDKV